jgi:UDP-GlcNAc:undecaprenyl-phosphate GlcNAc-1-phosphate transferase
MPNSAIIPPIAAPYVYPFVIAIVVALVATPIVRSLAISLDLYDRPDGGLKPHQRPIPYLGGVAMYLGWMAALSFLAIRFPACRTQALLVGLTGTIMMGTGLVDDLIHLRPRTRLLIQMLVAAILLQAGVGDTIGDKLLWPLRDSLPSWAMGSLAKFTISLGFAMFVIAGAANSTNLIDGLDGLCAGVLAISALGLGLLNMHLTTLSQTANSQELIRATIAMALLGATLGYLVYNFNPASIFMGDSGSLLLGFNVALLMIWFADQATWRWLAAGVIVFAFPILDTALAISRRALNGKPLFLGDRSHFYDQVRDRGLSVRQTVLICYVISAAFAALGVMSVRLRPASQTFALVSIPLLAGLLCWRFGMLKVDGGRR